SLELDPATLQVHRDPTALGLAAGTDLTDLSFDAMEVANTLASGDFEQTFDDFLAMVAAGHPACAMGSSDSHGASRFAGGARTFVFVGAGNDDPTTVDPSAIVAAVAAIRCSATRCRRSPIPCLAISEARIEPNGLHYLEVLARQTGVFHRPLESGGSNPEEIRMKKLLGVAIAALLVVGIVKVVHG